MTGVPGAYTLSIVVSGWRGKPYTFQCPSDENAIECAKIMLQMEVKRSGRKFGSCSLSKGIDDQVEPLGQWDFDPDFDPAYLWIPAQD